MKHTTLDMLMYRRVKGVPFLSYEQGECLQAFARDWRTMKNNPNGAPAEPPHAAARLADAKERILAAQQRLGPTMFELVSRTAGMDLGLEETEKKMDLPARSAKIVLRVAAEQLLHFKIYSK